jgi:excisionase family DNA binding protein
MTPSSDATYATRQRLPIGNHVDYHRDVNDPPRDPRIPDLISLREAAGLLGITKQALNRAVRNGRLRGAKIDGFWIFRRNAVERMKTSATSSPSPSQQTIPIVSTKEQP